MRYWMIYIMDIYGYLGIALLILVENLFPPIPSEVILTFGGFMTTYTKMNLAGVILSSTAGSLVGAVLLYQIGNLVSMEQLEKILEECNREQIPVENTEKEKKIRKQLREIEDKIQKLMACMQEASDISMKYINSELEKLDERKSELLKQYETPKKNEKQYYKGIDFEELDFEEKKMTAQAFIERINVYDDEIEIIWKV